MIPSSVRIFVCEQPQDMRRGFDGLSAVAREHLGEDPQSGALFVRRWQDHLPLHRLESVYARDGIELARSTMCKIERAIKTAPRRKRENIRQKHAAPVVERFFSWCDEQWPDLLEDTPLYAGVRYARNQRKGLERFLSDGRLPLDNNVSERELRRQAVGRKNWLFVGSDDGARANAVFTSLLASCRMLDIEPWAYLRDILCLLRDWPSAPATRSGALQLGRDRRQRRRQSQARRRPVPRRHPRPPIAARSARARAIAVSRTRSVERIQPIVPIMLGDARLAQDMAADLLGEGIYVIGFSYPVVPKGQARIRVQLSAAHTRAHLDKAIAAFTKIGKTRGVLS